MKKKKRICDEAVVEELVVEEVVVFTEVVVEEVVVEKMVVQEMVVKEMVVKDVVVEEDVTFMSGCGGAGEACMSGLWLPVVVEVPFMSAPGWLWWRRSQHCVSQPIISHPILLHRMEPPKTDEKPPKHRREDLKGNCTKRRTATKSTKTKGSCTPKEPKTNPQTLPIVFCL
eukprot:772442_1